MPQFLEFLRYISFSSLMHLFLTDMKFPYWYTNTFLQRFLLCECVAGGGGGGGGYINSQCAYITSSSLSLGNVFPETDQEDRKRSENCGSMLSILIN